MIEPITAALGGALVRVLPELVGFFNKKTDNAHELKLIEAQAKVTVLGTESKMQGIMAQGEVDQMVKAIDAHSLALSAQMQKTGFWFVDTLNFLVRPLTTYYLLFLYGLYKVALFAAALDTGAGTWASVLQVYTVDDFTMLGGVLGFWFIGRAFEKNR